MIRYAKVKSLVVGLALAGMSAHAQQVKTNVIFILADDLGYGDLSCYGQQKYSTPNIDKLAKEGVLFSNHYSGSTVCAPSRACLITGLHTGHCPIRGNKEIKPEGQQPLPKGMFNIFRMFKDAGYTTGAFGKWGLGYPGSEGDPNKLGVDEFYGYNCQRLAHNYYPYFLRHNQEKLVLKGNEGKSEKEYAADLIHEKTLQFIVDNKDKSFFLYVPSVIPHAELLHPKDEVWKQFEGKYEETKPFKGADSGPSYKDGGYGSQPEPRTAFAAMVTRMDNQVGEIMDKLKELGIDENTIVMFSSDNGPHKEGGADPVFFNSNGQFKGYKRDLYEGGIRVPLVARWPGKIKPGSETDHVSAFWDLAPTFADIAHAKIPVRANIDGLSFLPEMFGKKQKKHDYLYWEFRANNWNKGRQAIRKGKWKAIKMDYTLDKIELYDLENDLSEKTDVAEKNSRIIAEMAKLFAKSRIDSELYPLQKK